jgi:hypothetical protein
MPTSVVVKLVATAAGGDGTGTSCANSAASIVQFTQTGTSIGAAVTGPGPVNGIIAWGTTVHPLTGGGFATVESKFTPATLSFAELASLSGRCAFIIGNGSGFGICNSCRAGGLGSPKM